FHHDCPGLGMKRNGYVVRGAHFLGADALLSIKRTSGAARRRKIVAPVPPISRPSAERRSALRMARFKPANVGASTPGRRCGGLRTAETADWSRASGRPSHSVLTDRIAMLI